MQNRNIQDGELGSSVRTKWNSLLHSWDIDFGTSLAFNFNKTFKKHSQTGAINFTLNPDENYDGISIYVNVVTNGSGLLFSNDFIVVGPQTSGDVHVKFTYRAGIGVIVEFLGATFDKNSNYELNGTWKFNNDVTISNLKPANNTVDIGASDNMFDNIYVGEVHSQTIKGATITLLPTGSSGLVISDNLVAPLENGMSIGVTGSTGKKFSQMEISGKYTGFDAEFTGTTAVRLPAGATNQRPTGAIGMLRLNTEHSKLEVYTANGWGDVAEATIQRLTFSTTTDAEASVNGGSSWDTFAEILITATNDTHNGLWKAAQAISGPGFSFAQAAADEKIIPLAPETFDPSANYTITGDWKFTKVVDITSIKPTGGELTLNDTVKITSSKILPLTTNTVEIGESNTKINKIYTYDFDSSNGLIRSFKTEDGIEGNDTSTLTRFARGTFNHVTLSGTPTADTDAVTKKWVEDYVGDITYSVKTTIVDTPTVQIDLNYELNKVTVNVATEIEFINGRPGGLQEVLIDNTGLNRITFKSLNYNNNVVAVPSYKAKDLISIKSVDGFYILDNHIKDLK